MKIGVDNAEDKGTIDVSSNTQFITHKEMQQQNNYILKASNIVNIVNDTIAAMPRILLFSIWNFDLVFEPHMQTNGNSAWNFLFIREVIVAFELFRVVVSVTFYLSNNNKNLASFPVVAWRITNTVAKNRVQIRNIERGMANLPLRQHLV